MMIMPRLEGYRFGRLVVNGEEPRTLIVLLDRVVTNWLLADTDSSWTTSKMSASTSRSTWSWVLVPTAGSAPRSGRRASLSTAAALCLGWQPPARGDHQWVGGGLVHDRLRPVRRRHDQDGDTTSLGRCPSSCGCAGSSTWFRDSTACFTTAAWPIAILGSVCLGAGLAWPGYRLWQTPAGSDVLASDKPTEYEHRIFGESRRETAGTRTAYG